MFHDEDEADGRVSQRSRAASIPDERFQHQEVLGRGRHQRSRQKYYVESSKQKKLKKVKEMKKLNRT